ncbi:MAG: DUF1566 domain-containing protein [Candidatus Nitrohelix vancouverensis]|uniref:DUF1566 domain-containing protein n=1 Tax=Candidatus Nitrohelix vancouverensis TaxID=2705534 RepID=A0A7T0C207_9BACT|nr:MAG: DUF1566 domain-containing protein [Candidatus Nitrohelix vancouverensis]
MTEEQKLPEKREGQVTKPGTPEAPKRWIEKGPHVIFDTVTKIYWMKKDSWQDKGKFFNWHEARDYTDNKNMRKIGGFNDWRLPNSDEAATLYDESLKNVAKGGGVVHIDGVFPEESFRVQWLTGDTSTRRPRFDYAEGKVLTADEYSFGSVRICRKDPVGKINSQNQRRR